MNLSESTALVTGGCGYVGRQLCLQLLALGHHLVVVDDLSAGMHPDVWLKDAIGERRTEGGRIVYRLGHGQDTWALTLTLIPSDVKNGLRQVFDGGATGFLTAAFHLAGPPMDAAHLQRTPMAVAAKMAIDGSFFAWAHAQEKRLTRLVYVSPRDPDRARAAVAAAADAGEALAHLLARSSTIKTACVRLCALYGKDQSASFWAPALAHRVLRAGDVLSTADALHPGRHLLHVDDAVYALLLAAEHALDGEPVTVGAPVQVTAVQLLRSFARLRERPLTLQGANTTPAAAGEAAAQTGARDAVTRGAAALHFAPKVPLEAGLAQVMRLAQRREGQAQATMTPPAAFAGTAAARGQHPQL